MFCFNYDENGISLEMLKRLQVAGGVMSTEPNTPFFTKDVPRELIDEWQNFLNAKEVYNEMLVKYGIETI
jgi:hypothetical protein